MPLLSSIVERSEWIEEARAWLKWTALLFGVFLFMTTTWAFFDAKFHTTTGDAEWIWTWNWISRQKPVVFFASKNFRVEETAPYVRLQVASDPMYTVFFNEVEVGGGRWRDSGTIDVYDVTDLAVEGTNRVVIAVRAPDGVGGLISSIDTGPLQQNIVFTGQDWKITHQWSRELLVRDPPDAVAPRALGKPPFGRWDFPPEVDRRRYEAGGYVLHPTTRGTAAVALKRIAVVGGVAIAGREDVEATVWDFGMVTGRPRIVVAPGEEGVIRFRTVSDLSHLNDGADPEALVVAKGETIVTDPSPRTFRYVVALDRIEDAEVLSDRP